MDQTNFERYQRQQQSSYHGGQALTSTVQLRVPSPAIGTWSSTSAAQAASSTQT